MESEQEEKSETLLLSLTKISYYKAQLLAFSGFQPHFKVFINQKTLLSCHGVGSVDNVTSLVFTDS